VVVDSENPLKLRLEKLEAKPLSQKLPLSLKPTTTCVPHQAVEVSLWVKPAAGPNLKSVVGFETLTGAKVVALFSLGWEESVEMGSSLELRACSISNA
jgi:hypothetical protein